MVRFMVRCVALAIGVWAIAAATAFAAPPTKQNGSDPLFTKFTSICQVPGYLWYGNCNLSAATNTEITGRIDAVQPKVGRWNLDFTFTHLTPGAVYRLWGNQSGTPPLAFVVDGFFLIGSGTAGLDGTIRF